MADGPGPAGLPVYGHIERDRGATDLVATRPAPLRIGVCRLVRHGR
ncbi:hypothetical protein ACWEQL_33660 [Kitasatospora sp. NPDC004240]